MENTNVSQGIGKKKSLRRRITLTMFISIFSSIMLLTALLVYLLFSNIDTFIAPPYNYDSLEAFKVPIIIAFIIIAVIISIIIYFGVLRISGRITIPINQLTESIETIAEGDLSQEIPMDGRIRGNEIGILAQSFQNLLVTMRLGNKSYYRGDMTLAFSNYNAALELFRTSKNLHGQGMCLNNIGNIYRTWGDYNRAKESYDKAIEIGEQMDDIGGLSPRYNNRGILFLSEEKWDEAMSDFEKALELDKEMDDDEGIASRKRNIGVLHILKNELDLAQEHLNEAIKLDSKWEYSVGLAEDEFQLGRLALLKNSPEVAEEHFTNSLKFAEKLQNFPLMKNNLEAMIGLYENQGNTTLHHKAELELSKINDLLVSKKDVVFVIDQSGSMKEWGKMQAARMGALGVFNETINIGDRVAIIGFHSIINKILELTEKKGNIAEIVEIFKNLENTRYETALYEAIAYAIGILNKAPLIQGQETQERQKWVITLTDGEDNASKGGFTSKRISTLVKNINPPLNFILIGVGPELKKVHRKMTQMVNATPLGKYITIYSAKNVQKRIADAFKRVKEIMASSEIEGFIPEEG
ncbi:MAG: tetratricopeptide repeat protein [Promethearchaeota archaeon]|jgi:tetratricopeptide (TPR) repeat protein